jgi:hypothetical protein
MISEKTHKQKARSLPERTVQNACFLI